MKRENNVGEGGRLYIRAEFLSGALRVSRSLPGVRDKGRDEEEGRICSALAVTS